MIFQDQMGESGKIFFGQESTSGLRKWWTLFIFIMSQQRPNNFHYDD
jgi:hypothetical protein